MAKKKKTIREYLDLGSLSAALVLKNLPFVFFLSFLAIIYIANAHYAEKKVRQIQQSQNELKELRWLYMSLQSDLMYNSKRSEVIRDVAPNDLKPIKGNLKKIVIEQQ
ncbi:MAG: FtsL-like putative cell division protein [Bacteroidota bacterium]